MLAVLYCASALAQGNLYVFVFKNGLAQKGIEVKVGDSERITNEFGQARFDLPADEYEVSYYRDNKLFALTDINLLESKHSQLFLNLNQQGADVELDLPLAAYDQQFEETEVKSMEGPKGTLSIILKDRKTQALVSNARIFFKGYDVEANSDEQGVATVPVAEGGYDISVVHPKYIMRVVKDLKVTQDQTTEISVELTRSDIELQEFVVTAPFVEGSLASSITDLKDSDVLADAITSEQFSKSGDSSASGALKRVTGITIVDGKFVFIRGLGERYSTVLLNGLHIPSPEPAKRVVPLDIFPTGVIQSMNIQKTFSANLPGTFGGGTVLIQTRDIPEEDNYISGSVSLSYNNATGKSVKVNPDNDRSVPGILLDLSENFAPIREEIKIGNTLISPGITAQEQDQLNRAMINYRNYGLSNKTIKPGTSFSVSAGQSFKTGSGLKYGFAGTLYSKTDNDFDEIVRDDYEYVSSLDQNIHIQTQDYGIAREKEKLGGLGSFSVDTQTGHKYKYTLLALKDSVSSTQFGDITRHVEGTRSERTFLQYQEKELIAHQFNGTHHIGDKDAGYLNNVIIDWGLETAQATRLEPGTFEYEYKQASGQFVVDAKKLFYLYSDLEDEVDNARIDVTLPFKYNDRDNHTQIGLFNYSKNRNLDNRRFKWEYDKTLDPSAIDDAISEANYLSGDLVILDSYKPDDFYTAEQDVTAFFISQLISPLEQLDVSLGVRQEDSTQSLRVGEELESFDLETSDLLPSLVSTYRLNDQQQFRFAYSQSLSRPDFREFSPNRYKDTETGNIVFGFPELKYTTLDNIELKYEWYPSFDEFITFSLFQKNFTNPIETVRTQADVDIEISYRNATSADNSGFEIGFRKNLQPFHKSLEHFYVSGNYAGIDSRIRLDKDAPQNVNDQFIPNLTSENRPMQGQSPYVINLQFGYDNFFTRRSAVLLYNVFGERISQLGINGNPDVVEEPFKKLDFVLKWGLNDTYDEQEKKIGYNLSFKATNLLDSEVRMTQGNVDVFRFKPGRSYSLSFSMKF